MAQPRRILAQLLAVSACALGVAFFLAAPASAALSGPLVKVFSSANTAAPIGGTFNYYVLVNNEGDEKTDGTPISLTMTLPPGLKAISATGPDNLLQWDCSDTAFPSQLVSCELREREAGAGSLSISREGCHPGGCPEAELTITTEVTSLTPGLLTSHLVVQGGGAPTASTADPTRITSEPLGFGIDAFDQQTSDPAGNPYTQAAGHPASISTEFDFNAAAAPNPRNGDAWPVQPPKDAFTELPPGSIGNPAATGKCTFAQLIPKGAFSSGGDCPASSQVGVVTVLANQGHQIQGVRPLYEMVTPTGVSARFAFLLVGVTISLDASVRSGAGYGLSVGSRQISEGIPLSGFRVTFWGTPADPSHDLERKCPGEGGTSQLSATDPECAVENEKEGIPPYVRPPLTAFLRNPTACTAPGEGITATLLADSWFEPGAVNSDGSPNPSDPAWHSASTVSHEAPSFPSAPSEWGPPVGITGCDQVPFEPEISVAPTTNQADSPTGLNVSLRIPQNALTEPEAISQSDLKGAVVKFPPGMTVNPAQASGLGGCTEAQIDLHGENTVPTCPNSSKIGTVSIKTPLLDHPVEGGVYLAAQNQNPFHSLLALYLVGDDKEQSGTVIKLAGKVNADPQTGQLETVFTDQPQLPFEELHLELSGGSTAALITPPRCGTYATQSELIPWSGNAAVSSQSSFEVTAGPGGTACPPKPAAFNPKLTAGTATPIAGAYSPFSLRLTREDATQRFNNLDITLPEGLVGKLTGIPYCPDSALASIPTAEGTAAAQIASPSCPAASQVGTVTVGAGAGANPFYLQTGKAYLAGPYKGAPLSLAILTPALAGPFDLGNVVVRTALQVNPETAQITAVSDPLPTILDGIPLDLRDLRVDTNRPGFTLNPTSCEPKAFSGTVSGTEGAAAPVSQRFQVGNCATLPFGPKVKINLKGGTKRNQNPALKAIVIQGVKGEANAAFASVALPHSEFLDQSHIKTICTRVQFAAEQCPPGSVYGFARAFSPLLEKPLEGPVYLRSSSNKLPDLVAALKGQIEVDLDGRIDTDKAGGIRTTFETVPDAPVSKFTLEMNGGKKGLLVNSENICRKPQHATALITAQNGKSADQSPLIGNSCGGKGKKKGKH